MSSASLSHSRSHAARRRTRGVGQQHDAHVVRLSQGARTEQTDRLLTQPVLDLLGRLHRIFGARRQALLHDRDSRQHAYDVGALPGYLEEAEQLPMPSSWQIASLPEDTRSRRVEITGPINDPKVVINMLTRGADGFMADAAMLDFEDSMKPTWSNVLQGVENLKEAVEGTLSFNRPAGDGREAKEYRLDPEDMPLLMVRVRGLHLDEDNVRIDGESMSAGMFDLAVSAYHGARSLIDRGKTPMFYVPKCEHHLEARWWNDVFREIEWILGLRRGAIRVTFLIETLPAAFQMKEILFEIRERATALNVGRWDKIFSDIKTLAEHPDRIMADRSSISMDRPWMRDYALSLIRICHEHGALAMGGMAAFIPGQNPDRRAKQIEKVRADKIMEAAMGHDGCWVSHPFFLECALGAFERSNQLDVLPEIPERPDLLPQGGGPYTLEGLRKNVRVGIAYMKGWSAGNGCVAWDNLMEDLATLEISRVQVWQWLRHRVVLDSGLRVTRALVSTVFRDELERIGLELLERALDLSDGSVEREMHRFRQASRHAEALFTESTPRPFMSVAAHQDTPGAWSTRPFTESVAA